MYVMWWFIVYKFTVNCIVYSKLLSQVTSLHYVNIVYRKLLLTKSVRYYTLHDFVAFVFFVQSEAFLHVQLLHNFLWEKMYWQ